MEWTGLHPFNALWWQHCIKSVFRAHWVDRFHSGNFPWSLGYNVPTICTVRWESGSKEIWYASLVCTHYLLISMTVPCSSWFHVYGWTLHARALHSTAYNIIHVHILSARTNTSSQTLDQSCNSLHHTCTLLYSSCDWKYMYIHAHVVYRSPPQVCALIMNTIIWSRLWCIRMSCLCLLVRWQARVRAFMRRIVCANDFSLVFVQLREIPLSCSLCSNQVYPLSDATTGLLVH